MIRRQDSPPIFPPAIAQTATLFADDEAPELTPDDARRLLHELPERHRGTDRARFLAARSTGARWYCPDACTNARMDTCECPCGRRCHGSQWCQGH